jgi:Tfp pilus assembly protein PilX
MRKVFCGDRKLSQRRGSALTFALLAVMALSIVGLGLAARTSAEVRISRFQRDSSDAFNLAGIGCRARYDLAP